VAGHVAVKGCKVDKSVYNNMLIAAGRQPTSPVSPNLRRPAPVGIDTGTAA
jgi:hypothetical protein